MPESSALVEASERGGVLESTIGRGDGEGPSAPTDSLYPLFPDLRVLPFGFPVPRGGGLGSRMVKDEHLSLVYWIFQSKLSHILPPTG